MKSPKKANFLCVTVTDGRGRLKPAQELSNWLLGVAPSRASGEMVIALVCDDKMRTLNRQFRGVNKVTDVLSFPATSNSVSCEAKSDFLGDVVIAMGVTKRQARRAGHSIGVELRRLALHGLLHLLGYDHEKDEGQMDQIEREIWLKSGMANTAL